MICPKCRREIANGVSVCPYCGQSLGTPSWFHAAESDLGGGDSSEPAGGSARYSRDSGPGAYPGGAAYSGGAGRGSGARPSRVKMSSNLSGGYDSSWDKPAGGRSPGSYGADMWNYEDSENTVRDEDTLRDIRRDVPDYRKAAKAGEVKFEPVSRVSYGRGDSSGYGSSGSSGFSSYGGSDGFGSYGSGSSMGTGTGMGASKFTKVSAGCIGVSWLLVLLLDAVNRLVAPLYGLMYYTDVAPVFGILFRLIFYVKMAIIWAVIILGLVVIIGMIKRLSERKGSNNQRVIIAIIDAALVMAAGILYMVGFYAYGLYGIINAGVWLLGIASVVLGFDLIVNVFVEKQDLEGSFSLSNDIETIRNSFASKRTIDKSSYTDPGIPGYAATSEREPGESYFDGKGEQLFIKILLMVLLCGLTCGIAAPIMIVDIERWTREHTVIEGRRQVFTGTAGQLFGLWIKWILLGIVTCGIYWLFAFVEYLRWATRHTSYQGVISNNGIYEDSIFDGNTGEAIGNAILCGLITSFTCGIGYPWGLTMFTRWLTKSTVINRERYFYDGDGGGMFKEYIIVFLLNLITCGIYSAWGICRINRYIFSHTHVDARWRM